MPFLLKLVPFAVVIVLAIIAWKVRLNYLHSKNISKIEWVMLEIRIPKEVFKSPLAMELVINSFYQTFPADWFKKYWKGIVRSWVSLEIVSIEGRVYFLMKIPAFFKNLIESQIYAQYPQAEISEVPDYAESMPSYVKEGEWDMFGVEFKLSADDPYPIKTYVDYGLDRAVGALKEEERIDPLTPMMEFMGSLGPGEQIWLQILVQASMKKFHKPGTWFGTQDWKKQGKTLIEKLKEPYKPKEGVPSSMMTKEVQDVVNAVDRSISKLGFDCGIRGLYIAKKDVFNFANVAGLIGSVRQYGSANLNGLQPSKVTAFKFPWQDPTGRRTARLKRLMFDAYRRRSYFHPPYKREPFVLNSEELATIYHFPGRVMETPTLKRVLSKKSEPPTNLPM